jgi:CO dehydrogenase/acetyl-CoA synthase alpha subunit
MIAPNNQLSYIYFESKLAPGKVIDISQDPSTLGNAVLYEYHKSQNQHFALVPCSEKGYFYIQSQLSKKVLTVHGHNNANGAIIVEEANNNHESQRFRVEEVSLNSKEYYLHTFCNKAVDIYEGKSKNDAQLIQW